MPDRVSTDPHSPDRPMTPSAAYDLIAFDLDGTIVDDTVFVWETLHDYFQTPVPLREMAFRKYMDRSWTYEEWFEFDIRMLLERGANRSEIQKAIEGMRLMEGVFETLAALRKGGAALIVLSGSLDVVLEKFGLEACFDEIYLNRLQFDDDGELVGWTHTPYDVFDKAVGLKAVADRMGIPMDRTAFVGDNFNDVAVARVAGCSIAFNCKSDELARVADHIVPGGDLRAVLPLLQSQAHE